MGALAGVAIGDAMGMPTQTLPRSRIVELYGDIREFRDASAGHPVSHGLKAGTITDDTEQTLLLARHLIERQGGFDNEVWADTLLRWERDTHARGVNDLLGPSTKRAIEALQRGVPAAEAGRSGVTNGAAMRIVPVGIAVATAPLAGLVDAVEATSSLTHNTGLAIASAAAVAAMVSAALEGADIDSALPVALAAARLGETRGTAAHPGLLVDRLTAALERAKGRKGREAAAEIAEHIGTSVAAEQSIPMAFAVLRLADGDPWQAALLAANIGDDTDTIGAIACGMAGAFAGFRKIPSAQWHFVAKVNQIDLAPIVDGLLSLRNQARAPAARAAS